MLHIPNKKETHHVELINSQEDHKWWISFVYIGLKVCQLLNHYTSFATRGQTVSKKIGHRPSGGQIVKSHKKAFLYCSLAKLFQAMGIVSVDQMILLHLFVANSIFNFIICNC